MYKMGRRSENPKKLYNAKCRIKKDYGCHLYYIASPGRLKKLYNIHREGIRIYTGAFRTSPVEANELGLIFLNKLKSSTSYTKHIGRQ